MATQESAGLLNANPEIDRFLCDALKGEHPGWDALPPEADAEQFLQRARHHGVTALLHQAVSGHAGTQGWPAAVLDALRETSRDQAAQEMLRGHHLRRLLAQFGERGVPCLVIKGEALARTLYKAPGVRTRGDSDLFISLHDIERARAAVAACGFVIVSPVFKHHQFAVRNDPEAADVFEFDLHWRLLNAPRFARKISFEEAYRRSIELPGLEPARTLNPIDTLLLLCMHRAGSAWHDRNRLLWLYDIHLLVSSMTAAELRAFAERAASLNVQDDCLDGLAESRRRFDTVLPGPFQSAQLATKARRGLRVRLQESYLALLLDDWQALGDWRARRVLLSELMLPKGQFLLRKYGKERRLWLPLLYLRHLFEGIGRQLTPR